MRMKKYILTAGLLVSIVGSAGAETPLWMRNAAISPDGKTIAFTYKGDIYSVPVAGGKARRLTSRDGHETTPVWSPDSKKIAFADNRNGNFDIYIMDADGGVAQRLTTYSGAETPSAFSPDGEYVYFSASIQDPASSALFPSGRMTELYRVKANGGGAVEQVIATPAEMISFIPGTQNFLYQDQKGMENAWRKHHTSSVTRDIWMYDAATGNHTNLTNIGGEDRNPVVSPDGKTAFILSERNGGSMNVYSFPIANPSMLTKVSDFDTHPVRFLSGASNGMLAYTYNGELYTQMPGSNPFKVNVDIVTDYSNEPVNTIVGSRNTEMTVSPDGTQVAVINRGDIFVGSVEYSSLKQVTNTPAAERHLAWNPDGRSLVYVSERDGHWNIYKATIGRKDDPNFSNATLINEEPLFDAADGVERTYPKYSPDGKKLAFIEGRERLMVKDLASGSVKQLTDGSQWTDRSGGFNYEWAPDGNYITLEICDRHHDPYYDIAIVNVNDGTLTNLTNSGYFDMAPRWVLDGNAVMFHSDRYGMRNHASWGSQEDIFLIFMNRDAYDRYRLNEEDYALLKEVEKANKPAAEKPAADSKKKASKKDVKKKDAAKDKEEKAADSKTVKVELDGITDRLVRLTPNSSDLGDAIISPDGENLYYLAAFEKGYDLWKLNLRKKDVKLINKLNAGGLGFETDAKGKNIFLLGSSSMRKLDPKSDKVTPFSISGVHKIDPAAEREAMFNEVVNQEREMFYVENLHGVDWNMMTENYRRFLPHINNGYDFAEMLSELLGELNVSHTGAGYTPFSPNVDATASLGLLYDMTYTGNGLKVDEIVAGGPFDRAASKMAPGSIITKINGQEITPSTDRSSLFNGLVKKKTLVTFTTPAGATVDEVVLPITTGAMNNLLYTRWVKQRQADVDRLSGGRLGYVHIQGMSDPSFRTLYADVLGKYNDREGIVIDVRFNGGGRMHEDIEVFFTGEKYLTQEIRGKKTCDMPSRRWTKPSIMLVAEPCYSNAHGTPWVYKHQGIGSLVGMPVPGTMTSVNWRTLQNPNFYFGIPVIGYRTAEGNFLENTQLEPDIKVANNPATIVKGEDLQLKAAVDELLRQIDAKK